MNLLSLQMCVLMTTIILFTCVLCERSKTLDIKVSDDIKESPKEEENVVNTKPGTIQRYEPTWESLDKRPLPQWYDEAKIGIFLHWGVYSVPSFHSAWLWYWWKGPKPWKLFVDFMEKNYPPTFTYADFAPMFTAEFYDPDQWADIFNASGARYVVLTTKHHEGYCNWPSKYSWNWNSMDVGPKRDLVGDLAKALNKKGLRFGAYHSYYEFFNPLFLQDQANKYTTQNFVRSKAEPELYELVNAYKPDIIWSDGDWMAHSKYWNSTQFIAWLYNDSPVKDTVVINDRWGSDTKCKHGGYYTCKDRYNPKTLQKHKFEDAATLDRQCFSYRRNMKSSDVLTMEEVTTLIAEVVSCGGNLLLDVGPTKDGIILPIFEERLREMGEWLKVNGEGIYATTPWTHQNDSVTPDVWYTSKKNNGQTAVYAIVLTWPDSFLLTLTDPKASGNTTVTLLGYPEPFHWAQHPGSGIDITIPAIPRHKMPCKWAWVFKLTNISN